MRATFDHSIVESTAHRPWSMPRAPWLMTQSWHDLLFAHWPVDVSELRRAVPAALELDLFDDQAWLGIVTVPHDERRPAGHTCDPVDLGVS